MLKDAARKLNDQIDPEWIRRKVTLPTTPRFKIGINNDQWSPRCIALALIAEHGLNKFEFNKLELDQAKGGCLGLKDPTRMFLVAGILNWNYIAPGNADETRKNIRYYQEGAGLKKPTDFPDQWRHCIAVKDGCIIDKAGLHTADGRLPIKHLWLDRSGVPNKTKGYMYRFTKVYEVKIL